MRVRVRLFAMLRQLAGADTLELDLDEGATAADALARLRDRSELGAALRGMRVVVAVNREYVRDSTPLSDGDELALIPPVSGGQEVPVHVRITDRPLSVERVAAKVRHPSAGAMVAFEGSTRDVDRLHYEAFVEMATERMTAIASAAVEQHGLTGAAVEHRVGEVPLGEPSVVVAASAPHRDEAFAGARAIIDRVKAEAPIWKREVDERAGTDEWVEGSAPPVS